MKEPKITRHVVLGTEVIVVDDFISPAFQDFIEADIDPRRLQVQLLASASYEEEYVPAGAVMAFDSGNITHGSYWYLLPLLMEGLGAVGKSFRELLRIRIGVYFSNGLGVNTKNRRHIDRETPHHVALYYPSDIDGNTYIFAGKTSEEVLLEVEPKKGRIFFMDGSLWHCSSNPTEKSFRTTINFNFQYHEN